MKAPEIKVRINAKPAIKTLKQMQKQLNTIPVYTQSEVNKLIEAYQTKFNDAGCEGLPYYPEPMYIELMAKKVRTPKEQ